MREGPSPLALLVTHQGVRFPGHVLLTSRWTEEAGAPLTGDAYFRIVLLEQPSRIPAGALRDGRIAVCVPGRGGGPPPDVGAPLREARALYEVQAAYSAAPEPTLELLRSSLEQRAREALRQAGAAVAARYARGHVVTATGRLEGREAFASADDLWACLESLAARLLARAYPSIPIYAHLLPRPVAAEDAPSVFSALQRTALRGPARELAELGPGLGLSAPEAPHRPDPRHCAAFHVLRGELERANGQVEAPALLERLAHHYGFTYPLAQLYVLAFIALGTPETELELAPDHGVRRVDGAPLLSDRLTRDLVYTVAWEPRLRECALALRRPQPASWNTALPYLNVIASRLREVSPGETSAVQEVELQQALRDLKLRLQAGHRVLETLAQRFSGDVTPYHEALGRLLPLASSETFSQVYAQARSVYQDPSGLAADLEALGRVEQVDALLPEAVVAQAYLARAEAALGHEDLAVDRMALQEEMTAATLLERAEGWPALHGRWQRFRARWERAYQAFHAEHHQQRARLLRQLLRARQRLDALERLNSLAALGPPQGEGVARRFQEMASRLAPCPQTPDSLAQAQQPVCPSCRLPLGTPPPEEEAERLLHDLDAALGEQTRRLGRFVTGRILGGVDDPRIDTLLKVAQAADLSALGDVLDDSLLAFLRELLRS